jgi:hypothetical protein
MNSQASRSVFLCLVLLMACRDGADDTQVRIKHIERFPLADGVEKVEVQILRGKESLGTLHAVYAETDKISVKIELNPDRKPISEHAPKALLVTNAGFFTEVWKPTGFLKSENKSLAPFISKGGPAGSGLLLIDDGRVVLRERSKTTKTDLESANFGIQAGPRVIEKDGQPGIRSDDGKRRNRTIIGSDKRGRLVIACLISDTNWSDGLSLFELQNLIGSPGLGAAGHGDLQFAFALNLDGGPSTGFHLRHPRIASNAPESKTVQSVLSLQVRP